MFVFTFLLKKENIKNFQDYSLNFKGLIYDEKSLLSMKFTADKNIEETTGIIAEIIFSIDGQMETKSIVLTLPLLEDEYTIARSSFPVVESGQTAIAVVRIGDKKITLKTKVKNEF